MVSFWDVQNKNKLYSYALVFIIFLILSGLFFLVSLLYGNNVYLLLFLGLFSVLYPLITYFYSHKIVLFFTGAKPADPIKDIYLINVGEGLALAAGLKKPPKFYIIEDPSPNAFATGPDPDNAVIAVTRGLLNIANRQELEGVIAHEMSHIKNYDTRFMTVVVVMIGLISFLGSILSRSILYSSSTNRRSKSGGSSSLILLAIFLIAIITPFIARLISLAISRKREFLADSTAVQLTRNPEGLASALEKIKNSTKSEIDYGPARALFISDPQKEDSILKGISNLFSTHPPIEERIKILRSM
ncbi:MAG: M48 family metallopeptidase [Candidatus Anstonellaceae archaeon]